MPLRRYILVILIIFLNSCLLRSADSILELNADLSYSYMLNRLGKGWTASDKDSVKDFSYSSGDSSSRNWESSDQKEGHFELVFNRPDILGLKLGFDYYSSYVDSYWHPKSIARRANDDGNEILLRKFELNYIPSSGPVRYVNYYAGTGHYSWKFEGDVFGLYPAQFETERYFRVSGRVVPEYFESRICSRYGDITLVAGPEAVWGYKDDAFIKYDFNKFTLIHKNVVIPYGYENERLNATSISGTFLLRQDMPVQLGLKYQPFRQDEDYSYVNKVASGRGVYGSEYELHSAKTGQEDALGAMLSIYFSPYPVFERAKITYIYEGLSAGNKQEISLKASVHPEYYLDTELELLYRKPLIGPMPLLYTGDSSGGAVILSPRGPFSPFWVGWNSLEWDNRERTQLSMTMTFDPGPDEWFYLYEPNNIMEWNINPRQDSLYCGALKYIMSYYPTATDRLYHYNSDGEVEWDPYFSSGVWGLDGIIHEVELLLMRNLEDKSLTLRIKAGRQLAQSSVAYQESWSKPSTKLFSLKLGLHLSEYIFSLSYDSNNWGPESWHREFGEVFDEVYRLNLSRKIHDNLDISLDLISARESDYEYLAPEVGSFDEAYITFNYGFRSKLYIK